MVDDLAEILFQPFLQEAIENSSGMGRYVLSDVHPVLPSLQGNLKDGFGEVVMACDMPEPCRFLPLYSCQKKFL